MNASANETDSTYAYIDTVKREDLSKITKQIYKFPCSTAAAVYTLQNYKTLIDMCFGENCKAFYCLKEWMIHMNDHRATYRGLQERDASFLTMVFFCIDQALQIHWKSCLLEQEHHHVDDQVLNMGHNMNLIA